MCVREKERERESVHYAVARMYALTMGPSRIKECVRETHTECVNLCVYVRNRQKSA